MIKYSFGAEFKTVARRLQDIAKDQLPYATAVALTKIAKAAQADLTQDLGRHFTLRNRYVAGSIRIRPAQKRDYPNASSSVGTISDFMEDQIVGGRKSSKGSTPLGAPLDARKDKSSIIPKRLWVKELHDKKNYLIIKSKTGKQLLLKQIPSRVKKKVLTSFLNRIKRTKRKHVGKRGWKRVVLYTLEKSVEIPKRWDLVGVVEKSVSSNYAMKFYEALRDAIKTRKS